MDLRPAKATSPAHFHTALGDPADVAGTVLGQPYELFVFIVFVSLVSLVLAISLAPEVRDLETARGVSLAFMAALGVIAAWGILHASYALHYAYLYYRSKESPGGLAFPGEQSPKQSDFAYFAFTVGTSFAVSDVDVTNVAMRQATLGHQILSFFYNTAILATVISMATG